MGYLLRTTGKWRRHAHSPILFCAVASSQLLVFPLDHQLLYLGDRARGIEILRACLGTIHDGVAAIQAKRILERVQTFTRCLIASIDDPAVGGQERSRAKIAFAVPPIAG